MVLKSINGYNISYKKMIPKNPKAIIIAMHGFLGDKESSCISLLEKEAYKMNIGLIKFDWPGHGKSEVNGEYLRVNNCLNDLKSVVLFLKEKYNNIPLITFSTSFAGYITLLYNHHYPNTFKHIILRSPAIKIYEIFMDKLITPKTIKELKSCGYFNMGYERITKITKEFVDDLKNNDIFKIYKNENLNNISIIHGTKDDLVPIDDSNRFLSKYKPNLHAVIGADHRYKNAGELENVIEIAKIIINKVL